MDWSFFGNKPAAAAPAPAPAQPAATQPTQPATPPVMPDPAKAPEGMEAFANIFTAQETNTDDFNPAALFNIDPAAISAQVAKLNFTQSLPPELLQQAAAGGEEGVRAMMLAMNHTAQQVMGQQTILTTQIVQQALGKTTPHIDKRIAGMVRNQQVDSAIAETNSFYSDPAVAPLAGMVRKGLMTTYPNETPAQIANRMEQYFKAIGTKFNPSPVAAETANAQAEEQKWNNFFG